MADLPLAIEGTLAERIAQLRDELDARGLRFPLHFYLSDEWFTPDGATAIAIPFYLAHPRLEKLEEAQMFEVEGGEHEWCMRILRHEAGHAIDNAFRLRLRRQRPRRCSARRRKPYPEFYTPKPYSKSFVLHLDCLVRAEPPRRGLRRDVRRLADAEQRVAAALRRLAGAAEARIHGRADAIAARARRRASTIRRRSIRCRRLRIDAAPALPQQAPPLRRGLPELLRPRPAAHLLGRARSSPTQHHGRAVHRAHPAPGAPRGRRAGPASTSTRSTRCSRT